MEGGLEAKIHEGGKLCTFLNVTVTDSLSCSSGFHRLSRRGCRVPSPFSLPRRRSSCRALSVCAADGRLELCTLIGGGLGAAHARRPTPRRTSGDTTPLTLASSGSFASYFLVHR